MRPAFAAIFILSSILLTGCNTKTQYLTGYAEGTYRYISSNYSGVLKQLLVNRGDQVTQGQVLFILDPQPESDQLEKAKADLTQAQAEVAQSNARVALAQLRWKRQATLLEKRATAQDTLDAARNLLDEAIALQDKSNASLTAARSTLMQAEWSTKQKTVNAPANAWVYDTYFLPGEVVPAGQPVLALLAPQDIYAVFFVNGDQLGSLRFGQEVIVKCTNCKSAIKTKITFISNQAEYAPPILYSNKERSKLVFRVEATPVTLTDAVKLHPGQPLDITIK